MDNKITSRLKENLQGASDDEDILGDPYFCLDWRNTSMVETSELSWNSPIVVN